MKISNKILKYSQSAFVLMMLVGVTTTAISTSALSAPNAKIAFIFKDPDDIVGHHAVVVRSVDAAVDEGTSVLWRRTDPQIRWGTISSTHPRQHAIPGMTVTPWPMFHNGQELVFEAKISDIQHSGAPRTISSCRSNRVVYHIEMGNDAAHVPDLDVIVKLHGTKQAPLCSIVVHQ